MHAVNVFRRCLDAHQNHFAALRLHGLGFVRVEDDFAARRARRGRQAARKNLALGLRVDGGMQELIERGRFDSRDGFLAGDQVLVRHLDRNAQSRFRGALAVAGLEHPQLAALDRELHVLHVAIVLLEQMRDADEFAIDLRHHRFHRRLVGMCLNAGGFGDVLRRADAGHHVFALRVDEELAVKLVRAGRWIAREGDAGGGRVAHVAEHHGLHVDGGAPAFGNVVEAPIGDGALVHPRAEHGADGAPELFARVLREGFAARLLHLRLVALDDLAPVGGHEIGVEHEPLVVLVLLENLLEVVVLDVEHDVRVHLDESAIGIIREALIAGALGQSLHGDVVEAKIQHGVHHAGHRGARARPHRHQQRIGLVAEGAVRQLADMRQRGVDLSGEFFGILAAVGVKCSANFCRDGETGRHRQAQVRHFGQIGALAAQQVAHFARAFGLAVAERVNPFVHGPPPSVVSMLLLLAQRQECDSQIARRP